MATFGVFVTGSADDAFESSLGNTTTNGTTMNPDEEDEWSFWRWTGLEDLDGGTILTAVPKFWFTSSTGDEPEHDFWGHDVDNAAQATGGGGGNISGRARTTATMLWDSADLGVSSAGFVAAPDIANILQEMADSGHLAAGVFALVCTTALGTSTRDFLTGCTELDVTPEWAGAQLDGTYTPAGGGGGTQQMLTLLGCGA